MRRRPERPDRPERRGGFVTARAEVQDLMRPRTAPKGVRIYAFVPANVIPPPVKTHGVDPTERYEPYRVAAQGPSVFHAYATLGRPPAMQAPGSPAFVPRTHPVYPPEEAAAG